MAASETVEGLAEEARQAGGGPAGLNRTKPPGDEGADLALRVRNWYLADMAHPFWQTYIKQSRIDRGYYVGGEGQWVDDEGQKTDLDLLKQQGRAHVSINQIKPIVKVLTGFERQTRYDLNVLPQGDEDADDARIMSWLMKFCETLAHLNEYRSEQFKSTLTEGMAALDVALDWTENPVTGDIVFCRYWPGQDCLWDPTWQKFDLSDASHFLKFRWAWIEDLIAIYGDTEEKAAKIRASFTPLDGIWAASEHVSTGPAADAYGGVGTHVIEPPRAPGGYDVFYDPQLKRALVIEAWYPSYEVVWLAVDQRSGKVEQMPSAEAAQTFAKSDPDNVTAIRRLRRTMRTATVIPATNETLEDGPSQYTNDMQAYPVVVEVGDRTRGGYGSGGGAEADDVRGIVRDLRDAQRVENKRLSQSLDLVSRWSKIRRVAEENSVVDVRSLDDPLAETTIWTKVGSQPPRWDIPAGLPELSRLLLGISDSMKINIHQTSGINTDLLGTTEDASSSGIAIARRQAQGQVIATEFFDNHRLAGEIIAQRLARRIQQKFTLDEFVRLTNEIGEPVVVRLNPTEYKSMEGSKWKETRATLPTDGPRILRDVTKLKYDLVMSETPATPTQRSEGLRVLLEIVGKAPSFLPILADKIIELTDGIPNRHEIIQRVRQMQGLDAEGKPLPPPTAPGGMPGGPGQVTGQTAPAVSQLPGALKTDTEQTVASMPEGVQGLP